MSKFAGLGLIICLLCGLFLVSSCSFGQAQTGTKVRGVISSDTTWTKADSPINFTESAFVPKGVTLSIMPGVEVHFNTNTLTVNGTLHAVGTSAEPIIIDGGYRGRTQDFGSYAYCGSLDFADDCEDWDSQTGTGCIIENTNLVTLTVDIGNASIKLNNNYFDAASWGDIYVRGNSIISNNRLSLGSIGVISGSPVISNNTIFNKGIMVTGGAPKIFGNIIYSDRGQINVDLDYGQHSNDTTEIYDNIIAYGLGFSANGGNVAFTHNLVLGCDTGCALYSYGYANFTIQDNTIASCGTGIDSPPANTTIKYNNIENSSLHSFVLSLDTNFDATYNWWGTTDAQAINQSISDFKDHYLAGNVTFIPFLDAPNPKAPLVSSFVAPEEPSPTPTPSPSPTPSIEPTTKPTATSTPTQTVNQENTNDPNTLWLIIAVLLGVIAVLLAVLVFVLRKRSTNLSD